ncbi:hypothetical protein [Nocardia aurea]|uniref:hypothetical protein n=1 Tax=Nocardia aurea TaxID=2144174 RepID=UPI0033B97888
MRARHRVLLAVSLVSATLAGCSTEQQAQAPDAPSAAVATFGVRVPAVDQHKLQIADQVRALDPCGFFDGEEFAAYTRAASAGPARGLDDCAVGLTTAGRTRASGLATIALAGDAPAPDETETRPIAGETVIVARTAAEDTDCAFKVPLRLPGSQPSSHDGAATATPWARVEGAGFDDSELNCQVATDAATALVSALRENRAPRRADATVTTTLADRSPCELMPAVPTGYTISRFDVQTRPYTCSFRVDGSAAGRYGSTVTVDFLLRPAAEALEPAEGQLAVDVAGHAALREESPATGSCFVSLTAGPPLASVATPKPSTTTSGTTAGTTSSAVTRGQVVIRVFAGSCAVADQLAPVAAEIFDANP